MLEWSTPVQPAKPDSEERRFHRRLRRFGEHQIFFYGGLAVVGVAWLTVPWGLSLLLVAGPLHILAGLRARDAGRSVVHRVGAEIHAGDASAGYERQWSTREVEGMSNQQRVDHARLTGKHLVLMGIFEIAVAIVFLVSGYDGRW